MAEFLADRIFATAEAVKTVADRDGTPFYLYHKQGILDSVHSLHSAFSQVNGYQNYFHIRENNNPTLLKLLCQTGTGVSACGYIELLLAQACGFSAEQLLYEPTRRDPQAEMLASQLDATWMINSPALLPDKLPQRIILRYHPSEERVTSVKFPKIGNSKNGINKQQIFDVLAKLHGNGVEKLGLSLQVSSYSIHPGYWEGKTEILLALLKKVKERLGISLWSIHIGEGPGLPYYHRVTAPSLEEEAQKVLSCLETADEPPVLFTGVNRRLMEHCGLMVSKILEHRSIYKNFLVLDAGISQYVRSGIKQAYRHVSVLGRDQVEDRKRYFLVGELSDEMDRIASRGRLLPKVVPGEYCVFHDVGCGGRSMAMLYGCHRVAGEYLFEEDGTIRPISPCRTEQEVFDFLTAW